MFGLFAWACVAVVGLIGAYKGCKAVSDNKKATNLNEKARRLQSSAKRSLRTARQAAKESLESLGYKKKYVWEKPMKKFIRLFEQIKSVRFVKSDGMDELENFRIDKQGFLELKELSDTTNSLIKGSVAGLVTGGVVAFGAYGAVGCWAAASTGAAISSLSGVAASNATLAFLGGGALAAGGLGVAGGAMILGAIVAVPVLAVLGIVMRAKASANLDHARSNFANAKVFEEESKRLIMMCHAVQKRAEMFERVLIRLDLLLAPLLKQLAKIIEKEGTDYRKYKAESKKCIATIIATVQPIKALLDTPILTKKGSLTRNSLAIGNGIQKRLDPSPQPSRRTPAGRQAKKLKR